MQADVDESALLESALAMSMPAPDAQPAAGAPAAPPAAPEPAPAPPDDRPSAVDFVMGDADADEDEVRISLVT